MYTIYQTEGIVLGGADSGEANRYLYIFTKDLGLVGATAQGLRELKSKLRYSLQDFSYSKIDLVRGKSGWRVVSAQSIINYSYMLRDEDKKVSFETIARLCRLLRRLLKGEEKNEKLFNEVIEILELFNERSFNGEQVFSLEIIVVMRILNNLGYWGTHKTLSPFLEGNISEPNLLVQITKTKPLAIREINKALHETQL